jgi:hypothetical protein
VETVSDMKIVGRLKYGNLTNNPWNKLVIDAHNTKKEAKGLLLGIKKPCFLIFVVFQVFNFLLLF